MSTVPSRAVDRRFLAASENGRQGVAKTTPGGQAAAVWAVCHKHGIVPQGGWVDRVNSGDMNRTELEVLLRKGLEPLDAALAARFLALLVW